FACDLNDRRILRLIRKINGCPYALSHENQNSEDHGSGNQENRLDLRIVVPVGGALVTVRPIARDEQPQRSLNQHKRNACNDQNCSEKSVDRAAVRGEKHRKKIGRRKKKKK